MPEIVLIEPRAPNLHIFSQFQLPRLGCFILGAIARKQGWTARVIVEGAEGVPFNDLGDADLIGISTITSTAPRAYAIADRFRQMGVPVIMGGPHVTFLPEEALAHSDYVVRGEGEHALERFLQMWTHGLDPASVPNLSYRMGDGFCHNPLTDLEADLDKIPFPDFSLCPEINAQSAGRRLVPMQTSRGCPYNCSFCSVTGMFGHRNRFRSVEHIMSELRRYDDRKTFIFFYDDHFTVSHERTKKLLRRMIAADLKFKWSTQVRVELARDEELVRMMKQAGCHTLFIGLESVNPANLKAMRKNQTVDDIVLALKVFRKHRIHVHGMFVYGFDQDDWSTIRETVRFAKKAGLTSTQFMLLTPLPGSDFFDQACSEQRIRFRDWSLFDAHHAVFEPKRLTLSDLQRAQIFSHAKFYSFSQTVKNLLQGRWLACTLAHYARRLNRFWKKKNRTFLAALDLLRRRDDAEIQLDYRERIHLDEHESVSASQ